MRGKLDSIPEVKECWGREGSAFKSGNSWDFLVIMLGLKQQKWGDEWDIASGNN